MIDFFLCKSEQIVTEDTLKKSNTAKPRDSSTGLRISIVTKIIINLGVIRKLKIQIQIPRIIVHQYVMLCSILGLCATKVEYTNYFDSQ